MLSRQIWLSVTAQLRILHRRSKGNLVWMHLKPCVCLESYACGWIVFCAKCRAAGLKTDSLVKCKTVKSVFLWSHMFSAVVLWLVCQSINKLFVLVFVSFIHWSNWHWMDIKGLFTQTGNFCPRLPTGLLLQTVYHANSHLLRPQSHFTFIMWHDRDIQLWPCLKPPSNLRLSKFYFNNSFHYD